MKKSKLLAFALVLFAVVAIIATTQVTDPRVAVAEGITGGIGTPDVTAVVKVVPGPLYSTLIWPFSANADGVASAITDRDVVGGSALITWVPANSTVDRLKSNTGTLTVSPGYEYAGTYHWATNSSCISAFTGTAGTLFSDTSKAVKAYGGKVKLSLTGAKNAAGTGAKGKIEVILVPPLVSE